MIECAMLSTSINSFTFHFFTDAQCAFSGYLCDNGECTAFNEDRCDGDSDCSDGSDEVGCPCKCGKCRETDANRI